MSFWINLINISLIIIMFSYKATTYEQMEKKPKEKKFKQSAYEEVRKLIEQNEGNDTVNEIKLRIKPRNKKILSLSLIYLINCIN